MALDEFPELADVADDLAHLRVFSATVRRVGKHWLPVVMLEYHERFIPWMLGVRRTKADARGALIDFLRGVAVLRAGTLARYRPVASRSVDRVALRQVIDEINGDTVGEYRALVLAAIDDDPELNAARIKEVLGFDDHPTPSD